MTALMLTWALLSVAWVLWTFLRRDRVAAWVAEPDEPRVGSQHEADLHCAEVTRSREERAEAMNRWAAATKTMEDLDTEMFDDRCSRCGEGLRYGARFCHRCGRPA